MYASQFLYNYLNGYNIQTSELPVLNGTFYVSETLCTNSHYLESSTTCFMFFASKLSYSSSTITKLNVHKNFDNWTKLNLKLFYFQLCFLNQRGYFDQNNII